MLMARYYLSCPDCGTKIIEETKGASPSIFFCWSCISLWKLMIDADTNTRGLRRHDAQRGAALTDVPVSVPNDWSGEPEHIDVSRKDWDAVLAEPSVAERWRELLKEGNFLFLVNRQKLRTHRIIAFGVGFRMIPLDRELELRSGHSDPFGQDSESKGA
jgi:hypothetical protein